MLDTVQADLLARFLIDRLPPDLLVQVVGKLLDQPEPEPRPQLRRYRKKDFKAELGNIGDTKWLKLRAAGIIPKGIKLSSHLEIWTPEQVTGTVLRLAELEEERKQALLEQAEADAEAAGIPPPPRPRGRHLKPVPDRE
jgi:hypothetical protein